MVDLAKKHFPKARLVSRPTVTEAIVEVCQGRVDGAFFEENAALTALLDGIPCDGIPLRSIWEPSIHTNLGVASTFESSGIADEIRAEIGNIATEGRLSSMASRWGDFSVRNTETIHLLQAARQRERNLFAATLVFAFLLLLATWQTLRHRRETKRARRAEVMLRETEHKLRLMANNLSEIVLAYGMDRKLVFANAAVEQLTGHRLAELEARGFCSFIHADDQARMVTRWNGLFEGGAFQNEEFRLIAGDGRIKWMVANCGPILDDTGRQVGVQGSVQDVTERKLASELLRQSEERFRLIADTLPSLVWTARPDGAVDYVNRVFRDFAGAYGSDTAWTHTLIHPDDLKATQEHWEAAMQTEQPYRMEHRLRRHDGVYRWHLSCGVPALRSEGQVLQWCGTSTDIHELRLRESEERFREIADTAPVIVWITGSDGLHTFFNRQAVTFTGRKMDDLLGNAWMKLTHPDDRDAVIRGHVAALQAGRDFQLELRLRRADQTYRWMLSTGTVRWENGAYAGHVGTIVDITDLKRNQEEIIVTQKLESLGVLAAGIAHDFNNLLGSILLDADSILTEADAAITVRETAARIQTVAIRASEIVRQLLAFAGKGQALHAPFNASQLAGEMVNLLKASISKRAVVETELTPEPLMVHGNASQFQQVIMNLITNASESLGERTGTVTIRTSRIHIRNGAALEPAGGRLRQARGNRHRLRDERRGQEQDFRPVLHDEVLRPRPGTCGCSGNRSQSWGRAARRKRSGPGQQVRDPFALQFGCFATGEERSGDRSAGLTKRLHRYGPGDRGRAQPAYGGFEVPAAEGILRDRSGRRALRDPVVPQHSAYRRRPARHDSSRYVGDRGLERIAKDQPGRQGNSDNSLQPGNGDVDHGRATHFRLHPQTLPDGGTFGDAPKGDVGPGVKKTSGGDLFQAHRPVLIVGFARRQTHHHGDAPVDAGDRGRHGSRARRLRTREVRLAKLSV